MLDERDHLVAISERILRTRHGAAEQSWISQ
jgi:hypothetical protein